MFQELDKNGDGRLDAPEMRAALSRAGIDITPATVTDLVRFLANGAEQKGANVGVGHGGKSHVANVSSRDDMYITFQEFRDFLIMLPREATPFEIYKCESTRAQLWREKGRGTGRVLLGAFGDLSLRLARSVGDLCVMRAAASHSKRRFSH